MEGSDIIFDPIHLLYYKCYKINVNCDGSYIDSPDWMKNKKATISRADDDKSFQCAATVALKHEETEKYPQKI